LAQIEDAGRYLRRKSQRGKRKLGLGGGVGLAESALELFVQLSSAGAYD